MNLFQQNLDRYMNDDVSLHLIIEHGTGILSNFIRNKDGIDTFWKKYYGSAVPRVVLCGTNPEPDGASNTGIPFLDYQSLSQLISGIDRQDSERTAGFFFQVVRQFGVEAFFHSFYVTNVASVCFIGGGKNLNFPNYYKLHASAQEVVERNFLQEMEIVQPTHVISLSKAVQQTVHKLLPASVDCSMRLPHPSWITTYRGKEMDKWTAHYLAVLEKFRQ